MATLIVVVTVLVSPIVMSISNALPEFKSWLALVNSEAPLGVIFVRCSRATALTVTLCEPALAVLPAVTEKAVVWLLEVLYVLKSVASFNFFAASCKATIEAAAVAKALICVSLSSILDSIRVFETLVSASTKADTISFVLNPAPAPNVFM